MSKVQLSENVVSRQPHLHFLEGNMDDKRSRTVVIACGLSLLNKFAVVFFDGDVQSLRGELIICSVMGLLQVMALAAVIRSRPLSAPLVRTLFISTAFYSAAILVHCEPSAYGDYS